MKPKFTDAKLKSLAKKHAKAYALICTIERQIDRELDLVSDRMCNLENIRKPTKAHEQELKTLGKYENKLLKIEDRFC